MFRSPRPLLEAVQPQIEAVEAKWNALVQYYKMRAEEPDVSIGEAKRRAAASLQVTPRTIDNLLAKQEAGESLLRSYSSKR